MDTPDLEITYTKDYNSFSVYFNGIEHFSYLWDNYSHRQSWVDGFEKVRYMIEITMKEGEPLLLGYDDRNTWERVLKILSSNTTKGKKFHKG